MIAAATLLPIAPLLLLPFIIIFFIVVFPFWLVGVAVLWIVDQLVGVITGRESAASKSVHRAFRWVLTFGGFTESRLNPVRHAAPKDS